MLLGCYWDVVRMLLGIIRILLDNGYHIVLFISDSVLQQHTEML